MTEVPTPFMGGFVCTIVNYRNLLNFHSLKIQFLKFQLAKFSFLQSSLLETTLCKQFSFD